REANTEESASSELTGAKFQALESQASFDKVLYDGGEFGTGGAIGSAEELDFLGIPGLLDADQVSTLLKQRQSDQLKRQPRSAPSQDSNVVDHRQMKEQIGRASCRERVRIEVENNTEHEYRSET